MVKYYLTTTFPNKDNNMQTLQNTFDTRDWNTGETVTLKADDTFNDHGVVTTCKGFYKHAQWGWMLVLTNKVEIEMSWLACRLFDEIKHFPS